MVLKKSIAMLLALLILQTLTAEKMFLHKAGKPPKLENRLNHPAQEIFDARVLNSDAKRIDVNDNKLIVILVDFQEEVEDDASTTGNGKFVTTVDDSYPITIGAPPHNIEYFDQMMEGLRYYYKAASFNTFDLDYDVWPKDRDAYTLSNPMSYYSPPNVGSYEFVERLEEFFKESWETADAIDPEIDFSDYQHFMIIHAGSDWQHDVLGDSPSDMPSLFIKIGTGKEAIVDEGNVEIDHSCNVPETIAQDAREFAMVDDFGNEVGTVVSGYGTTNSVYAHEFGHSMGLIDLYSTSNSQPMVGYFDIMDSGGSGILQDWGIQDGKLYNIEGGLPALPGAFSREVMFEDIFREEGILKDITELEIDDEFPLYATSKRVISTDKLRFIKVPISTDEYVLLEHRSVDPDGDGDTAVKSALGRRVILYPTARDDDFDTPTYEYDFLLPSWQRWNQAGYYESFGGGVLAWLINTAILDEVAYIDDDGTPVSRFDNNSVNTNWYHRGVKLIEADNIEDIGNGYSYYWAGSAYEYFFPHMPVIDDDGLFVDWNYDVNATHAPILSNYTKPALEDSNGNAPIYQIDFLSNPTGKIEIKVGVSSSDLTETVYHGDDVVAIGVPFKSGRGTEIPIFTEDGLKLSTKLDDLDSWFYNNGVIHDVLSRPDFEPIIIQSAISEESDNYEYLVVVEDNVMFVVTPDTIEEYPGMGFITTAPIFFSNYISTATTDEVELTSLVAIGSDVGLYIYKVLDGGVLQLHETIDGYVENIGYMNCKRDDETLIVTFSDRISEYHSNNQNLDGYSPLYIDLSDEDYDFTGYQPIQRYFLNSEGMLLSYITEPNTVTHLNTYYLDPILDSSEFTSMAPTNMAFGKLGNIDNVLVWGAGKYIFAVVENSLLEGFPIEMDEITFEAKGYPRLIGGNIEMPTSEHGYVTLTNNGKIVDSGTYNLETSIFGDYYLYNEYEATRDGELQHLFAVGDDTVYLSYQTNLVENPIYYSGFRSHFNYVSDASSTTTTKFDAFIYPNPVRSITPRLRVYNPVDDCEFSIYDIAGNKIQSENYPIDVLADVNKYYDIPINTTKMSSGVYICILKDGKSTKKIKFAIEK